MADGHHFEKLYHLITTLVTTLQGPRYRREGREKCVSYIFCSYYNTHIVSNLQQIQNKTQFLAAAETTAPEDTSQNSSHVHVTLNLITMTDNQKASFKIFSPFSSYHQVYLPIKSLMH